MDWKTALKQILKSKEFNEFAKKKPNYKLLTMFGMLPEVDWEFQYSDNLPESDVIVFKANPIRMSVQPGFIAGKKDLLELSPDLIKVSPNRAVIIAENAFKRDLNPHSKRIIVLQNSKSLNCHYYTITVVTRNMEILSAKINAITSDVISKVVRNLKNLA